MRSRATHLQVATLGRHMAGKADATPSSMDTVKLAVSAGIVGGQPARVLYLCRSGAVVPGPGHRGSHRAGSGHCPDDGAGPPVCRLHAGCAHRGAQDGLADPHRDPADHGRGPDCRRHPRTVPVAGGPGTLFLDPAGDPIGVD